MLWVIVSLAVASIGVLWLVWREYHRVVHQRRALLAQLGEPTKRARVSLSLEKVYAVSTILWTGGLCYFLWYLQV